MNTINNLKPNDAIVHLRDKIATETISKLMECIEDLASTHHIPIRCKIEYLKDSPYMKRDDIKDILKRLPIILIEETN